MRIRPVLTEQVSQVLVSLVLAAVVSMLISATVSSFVRTTAAATTIAYGILIALYAGTMLVWINAEPGLVKSIAFNTLIIAGVSTVLVNGNPLLRFDGYYVLGDLLEIPNLAQRSNQYWGWGAKRLLFGVKGHDSPAWDKREAFWLFSYGIGSFIYRMFLKSRHF